MSPTPEWEQAGFVKTEPTPDAPNAPAVGRLYLVPAAYGTKDAVFVFQGTGRVEVSSNLLTWTVMMIRLTDSGIEQAYREPKVNRRFFRLR